MSLIIDNKYISLVSRVALAMVFIFAGIEKVANPEAFAVSISNYRILPYFSVNFFAVLLAWIEVVAGILLLFGVKQKENSFLLNTLLIIFTLAVVISVFRGLNIDCGCFGTLKSSEVGIAKIMENVGILVVGLYSFVYPDSKFRLN